MAIGPSSMGQKAMDTQGRPTARQNPTGNRFGGVGRALSSPFGLGGKGGGKPNPMQTSMKQMAMGPKPGIGPSIGAGAGAIGGMMKPPMAMKPVQQFGPQSMQPVQRFDLPANPPDLGSQDPSQIQPRPEPLPQLPAREQLTGGLGPSQPAMGNMMQQKLQALTQGRPQPPPMQAKPQMPPPQMARPGIVGPMSGGLQDMNTGQQTNWGGGGSAIQKRFPGARM